MISLYVAIGGGIGSLLRYLVTSMLGRIMGTLFPYGTLVVNVLGSFAMGLIIGYFSKTLPHSMEMRAFLTTGILGGFTTFSAFSLDTISLFEHGQTMLAVVYVLLSVSVSILMVFAGLWILR